MLCTPILSLIEAMECTFFLLYVVLLYFPVGGINMKCFFFFLVSTFRYSFWSRCTDNFIRRFWIRTKRLYRCNFSRTNVVHVSELVPSTKCTINLLDHQGMLFVNVLAPTKTISLRNCSLASQESYRRFSSCPGVNDYTFPSYFSGSKTTDTHCYWYGMLKISSYCVLPSQAGVVEQPNILSHQWFHYGIVFDRGTFHCIRPKSRGVEVGKGRID